MYLTGFADEAGADVDVQIKATKELGWKHIEMRNVRVDGSKADNLHNVPDDVFQKVVERLQKADVHVNCFGSAIGNWAKDIRDTLEISLEETERAISRMKILGTKLIRIMSYKLIPDAVLSCQMGAERIERLRIICGKFLDAGLQPVHENCSNYGGIGWRQSLELIENIPGLKLVFDPGNPPPKVGGAVTWSGAYEPGWAWDFYSHVKPHIAYFHVKDCSIGKVTGTEGKHHHWAGEGDGDVRKIISDLISSGYDGGFSIEPHIASVYHDPNVQNPADIQYKSYVEYGNRFMRLLCELGYPLSQ